MITPNRTDIILRRALYASAGVLLALLVFVLTHCGPVTMGPFYPKRARICGADPDCRFHEHCGFVPGHPQAVCLGGDSELDAYPSAP